MRFKHHGMIPHTKLLEIALMNQSWALPSGIKLDCHGKEASIIVSPSNQRSYSIGKPHGLKHSDLKRKLSFNCDNVLTARREERREPKATSSLFLALLVPQPSYSSNSFHLALHLGCAILTIPFAARHS